MMRFQLTIKLQNTYKTFDATMRKLNCCLHTINLMKMFEIIFVCLFFLANSVKTTKHTALRGKTNRGKL